MYSACVAPAGNDPNQQLALAACCAWPGMGSLTYQAILQRDHALLMGLFLIVSVCVIVTNIVTDLVYTVVDPRIRYTPR